MKAREVLKILFENGWEQKRQKSSHRTLFKRGVGNYIFAFDLSDDIGPKVLSKVSKATGVPKSNFYKNKKGG